MLAALESAGCAPEDVDYVNAHATATAQGDLAECLAVSEIFGERVPVSSTKGYTGHTLAACGAMELIFCLLMMEHNFIASTLNLEDLDPDCAGVAHVQENAPASLNLVMSNNFAFGGVNAVLVVKGGR
jgi:3-oxoacyl-[acyl-carrier-protein] synthase II